MVFLRSKQEWLVNRMEKQQASKGWVPPEGWPGWAAARLLFSLRDMDSESRLAKSYIQNFQTAFEHIAEFPEDFARRVADDMLFVDSKLFNPDRWLKELQKQSGRYHRSGNTTAFEHLGPAEVLERWQKNSPDERTMFATLRNLEAKPLGDEWNAFVRLVNFVAEQLLQNRRDVSRSPSGVERNNSDLDKLAMEVVRAYMRFPQSVSDVGSTCRRAKEQAPQIFHPAIHGIVKSGLNEIALLVSDSAGAGISKLSRKFRRLSRPDLALAATAHYGLSEPHGAAVWTSRAAAHADLGEFAAGLELCRNVWTVAPNSYVCTVRSRIHRNLRQHEDSHRWAKEGWSLDETKETAMTLVASSVLVGDAPSLDAAASFLSRVDGESDEGTDNRYIVIRAGWFLHNEGNTEDALKVAEQVLRDSPDYPPAIKLIRIARASLAHDSR